MNATVVNSSEKTAKVQAAITAHFAWFDRLKLAIAKGQSEFRPDIVSRDNNCEFGKWIYSDLHTYCPDNKIYNEIKQVHADFHKKAGEVLSMALRGDTAGASREIASGSKLTSLSGRLAIILRRL